MTTLSVITTLLAIVFFVTTVVLIWYIRQLFRNIVYINENHKDLLAMLENYSDHVESVHEMEMFYGDETLANLIRHSKEMTQEVGKFVRVFPGIGESSYIGEDINAETKIEE
tara:strand:+ start:832 stop:1167 length:336 start_codon:yes stop_codon:yes gene_type:complete